MCVCVCVYYVYIYIMPAEQVSCWFHLRRTSKMKFGEIRSAVQIYSTLVLLSYLLQPSLAKVYDATIEMKQSSEPLTVLWGIADTTAYVGKVFTYTLPSDAFQGNIVYYNITEIGKNTLPSWLIFSSLKTELNGIPGPEDKGQIYLEVKATGDENSKISDVFSINVIDDANNQFTLGQNLEENAPKMVKCKPEEPQTVVTVVVDCDLDLMKPGEKLSIFKNMVNHLNFAPEMLKLMPAGSKPMFDSSALVVGPGNIKVPNFVGALISWMVGCGQVTNDHMSLLQQVELSAANGDMSSAIGHNIVGWHVTNTRFQPKLRKRRQATPTPSLLPPAPTTMMAVMSTVVSSLSSVIIHPTRTVEMQTTKLVEASTVQSGVISPTKITDVIVPSEAIGPLTKMLITEATEILPTKVISMKSSIISKVSVAQSTKSSIASATEVTSATMTRSSELSPKIQFSTLAPTTKQPVTKTTTTVTTLDPCSDKSVVKRRLLTITLIAGEIKRHKIPEDMFIDCHHRNTSDMNLDMQNSNDTDFPSGFWLQLSKKTYHYIYANPLNSDIGNYTFTVKAKWDFVQWVKLGLFVVHVVKHGDAGSAHSHEISVKIERDYDEFISELKNRLELANKVAQIFGDKNTKALTVKRIEQGSVIYAWTNNSLAGNICLVEEIKEIVDKIITENGEITQDTIKAMHPYTVKHAASVPLGLCIGHPDFPTRSTKKVPITAAKPTSDQPTTAKPSTAKPSTAKPSTAKPSTSKNTTAKTTPKPTTPKPTTPKPTTPKPTTTKFSTAAPETKYFDEETHPTTLQLVKLDTGVTAIEPSETTVKTQVAAAGNGVGGSDVVWITTVIPAIVVMCVLIVAIIIACCLYRKRRKGKMKLMEQNQFSNKGVPVIFADEYEEKPSECARPLIMEDEKPPMPPPKYHQASSEACGFSNSSQPSVDHFIEEIEMEDTEISPLYSPPPPVTASNNSKPPHVQSSWRPPPYVPP